MRWSDLFADEIIQDAVGYINDYQYKDLVVSDDELSVTILGRKEYNVKIQYKDGSIADMQCTCPYGASGVKCEHMAAACFMGEANNKMAESVIEKKIDNQDIVMEQVKTTELVGETSGAYSISAEINNYYCYALQQNGGIPLIKYIEVKNGSEEDIEEVIIHIETDTELIEPLFKEIDVITSNGSELIRDINIAVHGNFLATIEETLKCNLKLELLKDGQCLVACNCEITVMPYNHWPGDIRYSPELLAAYILPSHPEVKATLKRAAMILKDQTGDDSLADYQDGTVERIVEISKAIYTAIQEKNISYLTAPPSFEDQGQKVRFPDEIMEFRMGTCLDMTLFYLACLEAAGIHGLFVFLREHIFAGLWLKKDGSFGSSCTKDGSKLLKMASDGIGEVLFIDAVAMAQDITFEEAVARGKDNIKDPDDFECAIDVKRARLSGVRPIPYRVKRQEGYSLVFEDRDMSKLRGRDTIELNQVDLLDFQAQKNQVTKLTQWERRLLDVSTRNILVNTRESRVVVFMTSSPAKIEDALADESEFVIAPVLEEATEHIKTSGRKRVAGRLDMGYEKPMVFERYDEIIDKDIDGHILHTYFLDEASMRKELRKLYNDNNSSVEETGSNVMYLALGMLKWSEDPKKKKYNYSPVILVPAEIINKSASKGYTLRKRDSETVINMTLLEMLKEQFGMDVLGLDELPEDEHGVDVSKVFAIMRKAIMNKEGWDVVECCVLGNFSFGQIVMWNDVHSHPEFLENNKVVRALISGEAMLDNTIPEIVERDVPYLPVSVDASQMRAVNMAANGVSFILQGPPGTGKSQTITAMIANALMKEKRVLFVAEKQAALDVVHNRLKEIGLDDFCLEIYSNKATKRSVLNQIARNMSLKNLGMHTEYEKKLKEITARKAELDEYVKVLHEPLKCGMSLRQLIDEYEGMPKASKRIRFTDAFLEELDADKLQELRMLLDQLITEGKRIGYPNGSKFDYIGLGEYSQSLKRKLEESLDDCTEAVKALRAAAEQAAANYGVDLPKDYLNWMEFFELSKTLTSCEEVPGFILEAASLDELFAAPKGYLIAKKQFENEKASLLEKWKEDLFSVNTSELEEKYQTALSKFFGKAKAIQDICDDLSSYSKTGNRVEDVESIITLVKDCRKREATINAIRDNLSKEWKNVLTEDYTLERLSSFKDEAETQREVLGEYLTVIADIQKAGKMEVVRADAEKVLSAFDELKTKEQEIDELLEMVPYNPTSDWLEGKMERFEEIEDNAGKLRDWLSFRGVEKKCMEAGLDQVCREYKAGMDTDELCQSFWGSLYKTLIWNAIESSPAADKFSGNAFNERIKEFKKADDEFVQVTREEILYQLRLRTPSARGSIANGVNGKIIAKAIKSGGRGITIRGLFEQTFPTINTCCPCMLMSPLSVAQYIPPKNNMFDLVIFDEASQLPTSKAVGVIARGKNAVIVGDPKQMPPTNFFTGKYEDIENYELEDLESILDDCEVIGMPNTSLRWHYRSRHESLIAFSNRSYYENGMFTFPSVNDAEKRVTLVKVNGRKNGNVNEKEAKRVVEDVLHRYHDENLKKMSLGIVTFNVSQSEYIKKLLLEEYSKDTDFEAWATTGEEPLFVKNLENVQGDERDVILFSVTFGPDEEGRFSINFGPLNKDGGWRRLNVAASRAKYEMVLFSSMTSTMIEQKHPSSEGAKGLSAFLKYAETGVLPECMDENISGTMTQGIKKKICEAITNAGYQVKTDLGHSEFKIDVAVVNPDNPEEYLMGIMLDGESYRLAGNTRDREIAQASVLKGLGWHLHRVWTMDWWDDSEREINFILDELETLKEELKSQKSEHWYPESEEIIYEEPTKTKRNTEKKGKMLVEITPERFNPAMPHTDSVEELAESKLISDVAEMMKRNEKANARKE